MCAPSRLERQERGVEARSAGRGSPSRAGLWPHLCYRRRPHGPFRRRSGRDQPRRLLARAVRPPAGRPTECVPRQDYRLGRDPLWASALGRGRRSAPPLPPRPRRGLNTQIDARRRTSNVRVGRPTPAVHAAARRRRRGRPPRASRSAETRARVGARSTAASRRCRTAATSCASDRTRSAQSVPRARARCARLGAARASGGSTSTATPTRRGTAPASRQPPRLRRHARARRARRRQQVAAVRHASVTLRHGGRIVRVRGDRPRALRGRPRVRPHRRHRPAAAASAATARSSPRAEPDRDAPVATDRVVACRGPEARDRPPRLRRVLRDGRAAAPPRAARASR